MRVLVVSPFLPYPGVPHAGGKLVHFLLTVLAKSHSVFLVSRIFPGEDAYRKPLQEMLAGIEVVHGPGPLATANPLSVFNTVDSYIRLGRLADAVARREKFDVCQAEFTETGMFWEPPPGLPSVLTCHDIIAKPAFRKYAESRGLHRLLAWGGYRGRVAAERRAVTRFRRVFTLSEEDKDWGERLYPGVSFRVLRYPGGIGFTDLPREEGKNVILFFGALNRPQNVEAAEYFLEHAWPSVRNAIPGARFVLAGAGAPARLREAASLYPGVTMTGYVENPEVLYKSAAVFVAPILRGGGIIVKILDAMAAGVAVVTTRFGNEGIRAREGREVLVADRPGEFAGHVIRLLREEGYRKALGAAGQSFVRRNFSAEALIQSLEETYREIVGNAPGA